MYKLIDCASFYQEDEVQVTLINLKDLKAGGLEKTAADDRIASFITKSLQPKDGKFYLHINAMGAGEFYGSNKNGDYFPEAQLKEYYKTFEETGYVYRHHINKDPAKSMGRVIYAIYNDRMHRVELIAEVDKALGADIFQRIQAGDYPQTSMACKTPYDVCSICGNKAHTRQEYCIHLTSQLNKVMPDGRKIMAMNVAPLRFFDISIVIKPADITSSVLQKVASESTAILSVDLAEEEGLSDRIEKKAEKIKEAAMNKLSTLTKIVDGGEVTSIGKSVESVLRNVQDPKEGLMDVLTSVPLEDSLNALAELGISPSIAFLSNLIAHKVFGHAVPAEFGEIAEEFITGLSPSLIPKESYDILGELEPKDPNPHLVNAISRMSNSSLDPDSIEKRAYDSRYYDGYLDTRSWDLPKYVSASKADRQSLREQIALKNEEEKRKLSRSLLTIGGAAVLAKMVLASLLEDKVKEYAKEKIGLKYKGVMKSASVVELMDRSVFYSYYLNRGQRVK